MASRHCPYPLLPSLYIIIDQIPTAKLEIKKILSPYAIWTYGTTFLRISLKTLFSTYSVLNITITPPFEGDVDCVRLGKTDKIDNIPLSGG